MFEVESMLALSDDMAKAWGPALYMGMRPNMFGYPEDIKPEDKEALVKTLRERFLAESLPKFMGILMLPHRTAADLCHRTDEGGSGTLPSRLLAAFALGVGGSPPGSPTRLQPPPTCLNSRIAQIAPSTKAGETAHGTRHGLYYMEINQPFWNTAPLLRPLTQHLDPCSLQQS